MLAIALLGRSRSRAAVAALTRLLDTLPGSARIAALQSLEQLGAPDAAEKASRFLSYVDERLRAAALRYLVAVRTPQVLPTVIDALGAERAAQLVPLYVAYLEATAPANARAAEALVPWLQHQELDQGQLADLCRALGRIAPAGHAPTLAGCRHLLETQETDALALACALAMKQLGDDGGVNTLLTRLKAEINRNRRSDEALIRRGNLYMALGQWDDAAHDYEAAIDKGQAARRRRRLESRRPTVVLPEPMRPMMPTRSPPAILKETLSSAASLEPG